jgi:hypothetical protein
MCPQPGFAAGARGLLREGDGLRAADRFSSVGELSDALERFLGSRGVRRNAVISSLFAP